MPVRTIPFRAAVLLQCLTPGSSGRAAVVTCGPPPPSRPATPRMLLHGTRSLRDELDDKNHYQALNLEPNASAADIKKSFFALSKAHHPDHNPADPHAPRRFMRISEAYATLSHTASRAQYDRDVLRLHHHHHYHRSGSYPSAQGPAGGRPASGLSRRRGAFRGPPPSFFRSSGGGGMGPGQEPLGRGSAAGAVPHFDADARAAHTRTQERVGEVHRARARRARTEGGRARDGGGDGGGAASDVGGAGRFLAVSAVLGLAMGIPYVTVSLWDNQRGREQRSKKR